MAAVRHESVNFSLAQAALGQRLAIATMVGLINFQAAAQTLWNILQAPGLTDDELNALQRSLEEFDFLKAHTDALNMEYLDMIASVQSFRNSPAELKQYLDFIDNAFCGHAESPRFASLFLNPETG